MHLKLVKLLRSRCRGACWKISHTHIFTIGR